MIRITKWLVRTHDLYDKYVISYIHTCRPTSTRRAIFHERHISSSVTFAACLPTVNFTSRLMADSSDFGLLGEQRFPKWEILCPGRWRTIVQNLTTLALSSAEKSVTVQTQNYKKRTVNDICTRCLSACVEDCVVFTDIMCLHWNFSSCFSPLHSWTSCVRLDVFLCCDMHACLYENENEFQRG